MMPARILPNKIMSNIVLTHLAQSHMANPNAQALSHGQADAKRLPFFRLRCASVTRYKMLISCLINHDHLVLVIGGFVADMLVWFDHLDVGIRMLVFPCSFMLLGSTVVISMIEHLQLWVNGLGAPKKLNCEGKNPHLLW